LVAIARGAANCKQQQSSDSHQAPPCVTEIRYVKIRIDDREISVDHRERNSRLDPSSHRQNALAEVAAELACRSTIDQLDWLAVWRSLIGPNHFRISAGRHRAEPADLGVYVKEHDGGSDEFQSANRFAPCAAPEESGERLGMPTLELVSGQDAVRSYGERL